MYNTAKFDVLENVFNSKGNIQWSNLKIQQITINKMLYNLNNNKYNNIIICIDSFVHKQTTKDTLLKEINFAVWCFCVTELFDTWFE